MTTTKKELVDRIADKTQTKRILVKNTFQSFIDDITNELAVGLSSQP
jgi:nucleoid DNA-binding protein